jgi:antitoxin (DNA-binding transcriptional repressor) of toxin-antitoxin stability system
VSFTDNGKQRYDFVMAVIHISESEAALNFAALMDHVRAGGEVVIDRDASAVAVVRPAIPTPRRLSESLRLAKAHASTVTLDDDFGRDLTDVIHSHREAINSEWE